MGRETLRPEGNRQPEDGTVGTLCGISHFPEQGVLTPSAQGTWWLCHPISSVLRRTSGSPRVVIRADPCSLQNEGPRACGPTRCAPRPSVRPRRHCGMPGRPGCRHAAPGKVKVTAFFFLASRALRCGAEGCSGPPKFAPSGRGPKERLGAGTVRRAAEGWTPIPASLCALFSGPKP